MYFLMTSDLVNVIKRTTDVEPLNVLHSIFSTTKGVFCFSFVPVPGGICCSVPHWSRCSPCSCSAQSQVLSCRDRQSYLQPRWTKWLQAGFKEAGTLQRWSTQLNTDIFTVNLCTTVGWRVNLIKKIKTKMKWCLCVFLVQSCFRFHSINEFKWYKIN